MFINKDNKVTFDQKGVGSMLNNEKALNAIRYHIGCDLETAKLIFNGVFPFHGDFYSAYEVNGKLEIW